MTVVDSRPIEHAPAEGIRIGVADERATDDPPARQGPRRAPWVEGVVLAGGLAALGGAAFAAAFATSDLTRPVAAGAVGGAAVSAVVTGVARRRLAAASLAAVAVLVPLAMAAIGGGPSDIVSGLNYRLILTTAVPTPADPPALVVPFAVTAVAAFLGAEIAQRTRSAAGPVLPSLVALVGGLAFGLDGSAPPDWVAPAWAALAALVVGLRRRSGRAATADSSRPSRSSRRVLTAIPVALAAAAVGHAIGPSLPGADGRERFELRDLVDPPAPPEQLANPLVLMAGLQEGADDTMFVAETSEPVERWRLATLDAYDGRSWTSDVSFVPAGHRLPEPADDGDGGGDGEGDGDGTTVTQTIEPAGLEGQWLPVVDRPVEISVDDVLFDSESGVLLTSSTQLPESYRATSVVPRSDAATLSGAAVATDEEAERALDLPDGVPEDIRAAADEITAGASSGYMKATAIERFLAQSTDRVPFRLAVEQPPTGHSFGHLRCFLFDTERCRRQGSTEQFVAAYALLARLSGLPTRIAVGFTSSGSSGRDEVTAHDATAWTEVKFDGIGWVPFNPVPNPDVTNTPPPTDVAGGGGTPDSQTSTTIARPDDDASGDQASDGEEATSSGGGAARWLALAAVALVALLASPAVIKARRRRRRRRAPSPSERIAGAWDEAVDQLARSGVRPQPAAAVRDVVLAGRIELDQIAEPLGPLGDLVNRTRFARGHAAEADAAAAWQLSDAFADRRRKSRTVPQRTREHFSVRSAATRLARTRG